MLQLAIMGRQIRVPKQGFSRSIGLLKVPLPHLHELGKQGDGKCVLMLLLWVNPFNAREPKE